MYYEQNEDKFFFLVSSADIENPSKEQRLVSSPFRKWKSKIWLTLKFVFCCWEPEERNILISTAIATKREIKYDLCNKNAFRLAFYKFLCEFLYCEEMDFISFETWVHSLFSLFFFSRYYFTYQHLANCRFQNFLAFIIHYFFFRYCSFQNSSILVTIYFFIFFYSWFA